MRPLHFPDTVIQAAAAQAVQATLISAPNPRVGCVIVDAGGRTLGQGHTQLTGGPHAEIMALRDAVIQGHSVEGATAYVTLEPCSHHGRTPPCCDALIAAGIKIEVGPGDAESRELNIGFFSRMIRKTPWVRMKMAASLDGTTALTNGQSQWITSPEAD